MMILCLKIHTGATAQLNIEDTVNLLPWVVIDLTFIPQDVQHFNESDDSGESDFDVTDLMENE